jgi:hypothetical protein
MARIGVADFADLSGYQVTSLTFLVIKYIVI